MNLESRINKTESCWLWTGTIVKGYGQVKIDGRRRAAHLAVYEELIGPIPEDKVADHLCEVKNCVNPDHIEFVYHAENRARTHNRVEGQCPNGHVGYLTARTCKECIRQVRRKYYLRVGR